MGTHDCRDVYKKFARYYDAYVQHFCEDLPLYLSLCANREPILEIGCGTGRVLAPILSAGHKVTGVDISTDMLSIAEGKLGRYLGSGQLRLLNHDLRCSPMDEQYACVLVTFYTFNYLLTDEDQSAFLSHAFLNTASGGALVMDLFRPSAISSRWQILSFDMDGEQLTLRRKTSMVEDLEERIQIFTLGGKEEEIITYRRYCDKHRVSQLLEQAGFTNIAVTDGYDQSAFHRIGDSEPSFRNFVIRASKP